MSVLGYTNGYDPVCNEYDESHNFTLCRVGQYYYFTLMGDMFTPPCLEPETAFKSLTKTLHQTFYVGR